MSKSYLKLVGLLFQTYKQYFPHLLCYLSHLLRS